MASEQGEPNPEEQFRDMLRELLSGSGAIDPAQLAGAAGLPNDPAAIAGLMAQLQRAMAAAEGGGIDWSVASQQGEAQAASAERQIQPLDRAGFEQAFQLAPLWLDEATAFGTTGSDPKLLTRRQWVSRTMPVWTELAEPVATSIADALMRVMSSEAPDELQSTLAGANSFLRSIGGTLFAMQLGHVVGQLAAEVVSGGDVGIPLLPVGESALLPQNVEEFARDLDIAPSEIQLYVTIRELAHARLFKHARWLRLHVLSSIGAFARGVHIDLDRLREVAEGFDPSNAEQLQQALKDGSLIPPKSEAQLAALARLETTLALIEGWVDAVTNEAAKRLPKADAIAETIRRRRAAGGPAESAFGALVGLELRPRKLREAAELWRRVGAELGLEAREALWAHPDALPSEAELLDPELLIARLSGRTAPSAEDAAFDEALEQLLRGETPPAPADPESA